MTPRDAPESEREIVLERSFAAPRELVWRAWTEADEIAAWWGPDGFSTTTHEMDVRVGGKWRFVMHGPDGTDFPNLVIYREVVRPERLVYDHGDDDGTGKSASSFLVTVTFTETAGGTRIVSRMLFDSKAARDATVELGAIEGGKQTLTRLARHLEAIAAG